MKVYVTADTHFNHEKIMVYEDRPFSTVEDMNEYIIDRWNSVVTEEDRVWR
jgi:calcineurin-like phosphoesterase family protein